MNTLYALFGVECSSGWEKLYQPLIDKVAALGGQVFQVKEKFGSLRFYYDLNDATEEDKKSLAMMVDRAEGLSTVTCEQCGEPGTLAYRHGKPMGWMRTLCPRHAKVWELPA